MNTTGSWNLPEITMVEQLAMGQQGFEWDCGFCGLSMFILSRLCTCNFRRVRRISGFANWKGLLCITVSREPSSTYSKVLRTNEHWELHGVTKDQCVSNSSVGYGNWSCELTEYQGMPACPGNGREINDGNGGNGDLMGKNSLENGRTYLHIYMCV